MINKMNLRNLYKNLGIATLAGAISLGYGCDNKQRSYSQETGRNSPYTESTYSTNRTQNIDYETTRSNAWEIINQSPILSQTNNLSKEDESILEKIRKGDIPEVK
jgi:hypothetical protein